MAVASIAALLDFESAFESAAQAILTAANINSFISQQAEKLPLISTAIGFDTGPAIDELTMLPLGGQTTQAQQDFFRYVGTLLLEVGVNRDLTRDPDQSGAVSFLGQIRGQVRAAFMMSQWPFNDTNLPYYRVSEIRPSGTVTVFERERNVDTVSLRFAITFAIQPSAWPTGFPPA